MFSYGGTGKSGKHYYYYACKKAKKHQCQKKIIGKTEIEDRVAAACLSLLTDESIAFIAKKVAEECDKDPDSLTIRNLKKSIQEADAAIESLWRAIESGQAVDMLTARIQKRQAEKEELETQLAVEQNKRLHLTEPQVRAFLDYVRSMPSDSMEKKRAIMQLVHQSAAYDLHLS